MVCIMPRASSVRICVVIRLAVVETRSKMTRGHSLVHELGVLDGQCTQAVDVERRLKARVLEIDAAKVHK